MLSYMEQSISMIVFISNKYKTSREREVNSCGSIVDSNVSNVLYSDFIRHISSDRFRLDLFAVQSMVTFRDQRQRRK